MGRRLILGTNVLIAYERGTIDWATLGTDELAVAALSIAEYRVGIELADTPVRAADRTRALAAITSAVDVLDYTEAACRADRLGPRARAARLRSPDQRRQPGHPARTGTPLGLGPDGNSPLRHNYVGCCLPSPKSPRRSQ